jgi:hypothetical protein
MDIPTFRYMTDAEKFLKTIGKEVDENQKLMKMQQKALASNMAAFRLVASDTFDITGDPDGQRLLVRKNKRKIDPELKKIEVPNMKKLEKQYNLAEDFYEKLRGVEKAEAQVQMTFGDRRGAEYNALMAQFRVLKEKIQGALRECLQFLADVAQKHVPKTFQKYIDDVVELVNEHVIFRDSQTFMYVSTDPEGNLVFTAYIMLMDVANDEGHVAPQLYISLQWVVGKDNNSVYVELNHEYEVPNKLLGQGESCGSVGEAVKAISNLLEMENYSTVLGVVPLALQLNVDPTSIKVSQFRAKEVLKDVRPDEHALTLTFDFVPELTSHEAITEAAASIYMDLKALMKRNGAKLTMTPIKDTTPASVTFKVVKPAEGGEFSNYDYEFLRDRFGLNNTQLRKIGNIINQGKD